MVSPMTDMSTSIINELHNDPRTQPYTRDIEVTSDRGIITLAGTVPSQQVSDAAEEIARNSPGVISVHNELKVMGK
jgi:osmotically-inducible protein OsmY